MKTQRQHTDWTLLVSTLGEDDFRELLNACLKRFNPHPTENYKPEDVTISAEIDGILRTGQKIAGIKKLRQQYVGMTLKNAKECIDAYMVATGIPSPYNSFQRR